MTEKMDQIQQGLVECMEATLSEVRRHQSAMVSNIQWISILDSYFDKLNDDDRWTWKSLRSRIPSSSPLMLLFDGNSIPSGTVSALQPNNLWVISRFFVNCSGSF